MAIYDDTKEEMIPLKGDGSAAPYQPGIVSQTTAMRDPTGYTGAVGASSGANLSKSKDCTVVVRYHDVLLEVDVYAFPDSPLRLNLFCPKCGNSLTVESDKKQLSFEKHAPQKMGDFMNCGKLNVEPFMCTWERPDAGAHRPGLVAAPGETLCKWKVGITNNIAKDA